MEGERIINKKFCFNPATAGAIDIASEHIRKGPNRPERIWIMTGVELEEAVRLILEHTGEMSRTTRLGLVQAGGFVLAQDLIAEFDNPPFDRSPIDGYAVRSQDIAQASKEHPVTLKVIAEVNAGQHFDGEVRDMEAVRIMTGAPIPKGADCAIRQEDTNYGEDVVEIYAPQKKHDNYCFAGEDFKRGTIMLPQGTKLKYPEIAILASMGIPLVPVYEKPRIALFVTGDEVVMPGEPLVPGKIYNSNLFLVQERLKSLGAAPEVAEHVTDDAATLAGKLEEALSWADCIITTGGVSVGKKDILHQSLPMIGAERIFWKVSSKPGTPVIFSVKNNVPIVSLSGNPFAATVNLELLIRPLLAKLMRDGSVNYIRREAVMADEFLKPSGRRRFVRAICEDNAVRFQAGLHASGALSSLAGCNCIIDIPANTQALRRGDKVSVIPF